ncbi:MAG TPA: IPT/TIG domain-containing protein [Longimicrobium sp.]|nr:IPT/TIG domain-containing protein [Longimicrobium sp.]
MHRSNPLRRTLLRLATAALPLLAACGDRSGTPASVPDPDVPLPRSTLAALRCTASVANPGLACENLALTGVGSASGAGPRMNLHVLGGQGTYVRLASASPGYDAGTQVFSFTVTVQDLTTLALATTDGATRHAKGVQVFFAAPPSVTSGGPATITIPNATGQGTFTGAGQDYFQYGGQIGGVDQPELGADGILSTGEVSSAKTWQLNVPNTVSTFSFVLYVSTETPPGSIVTAAPQVTGVSPNPLVPGAPATLTGINFNATPASNTVSIGGRTATVTGGGTTSLTVTVPCTSSGSVPVFVTTGGMKGAPFSHPLQVTQHSLGVGQALVLTTASTSACNELAPTGTAARYVVTVFSANASPASNAPFQFSANVDGAAPAVEASRAPEHPVAARLTLDQQMEAARQQVADRRHYELLERNRAEYVRLRARFGTAVAPRARIGRDVVSADPALTRTFRIPNILAAGFCDSYYVVSATRVYYNGKLAIYEDDATPDAFKGSLNPTMAANYQKIGDQFNADMEPIVRNNFGDILRRDAVTDNNGIEIALFTPRINTSFGGVAGFVASCDQFPNDDAGTPPVGGPYSGTGTNGSSNFGEFFYAYQPTVAGSGYTTVGTADYWYRTIRSTFIHESKHIASQAARVANGAPDYEASWLEEGTARHSEELWMRNAVDNVAWKGNTGYGSAANAINLYCDARPTSAACNVNIRRPAVIMQRHFSTLANYQVGENGRFYSPFGPSPDDTQSLFYAFSWSLVRYAIDRYGASDAAFLTALTNSTTSGTTNLAGRAGVSISQLLGGWGLTLYADDYPGLAAPSADIQFPPWNMRDIYAGLNADFSSIYTSPFLLVPTPLSFGTFAPLASATLRGGGTRYFEFSGTHAAAQLLRLEASGGGTPSTDLRVAVARLQ